MLNRKYKLQYPVDFSTEELIVYCIKTFCDDSIASVKHTKWKLPVPNNRRTGRVATVLTLPCKKQNTTFLLIESRVPFVNWELFSIKSNQRAKGSHGLNIFSNQCHIKKVHFWRLEQVIRYIFSHQGASSTLASFFRGSYKHKKEYYELENSLNKNSHRVELILLYIFVVTQWVSAKNFGNNLEDTPVPD